MFAVPTSVAVLFPHGPPGPIDETNGVPAIQSPQREWLFEPLRDFVDELLRPAGPPLRAGFFGGKFSAGEVSGDAEEGSSLGRRFFELFLCRWTVSTNEATVPRYARSQRCLFGRPAIASGTDDIPSFFRLFGDFLSAPGKRQRWPLGPWRNGWHHLPLDACPYPSLPRLHLRSRARHC